MAVLEEVSEEEDEPQIVLTPEAPTPEPATLFPHADLSHLSERLKVPEELLAIGRTNAWSVDTLKRYHRESLDTLQCMSTELKRQRDQDMNLSDLQRQESLLVLLRLSAQDDWVGPEAEGILVDLLASPLLTPPTTLPLRILTHIIRPVFSPHPSLSLKTARALPRLAGGEKARQDLFDGDVQSGWKGAEGWGMWNLLGWCLGFMDATSVEENIGLILPPMLTMMDDYEPVFRLRGIRVLERFSEKVGAGTMKRMGIDKLFIQSLQHSISLHPLPPSPTVLSTALPLLIRLSHLCTPLHSPARAEIIAEAVHKGIINGWSYAPTSMAGLEELRGIAWGVEFICDEIGVGVVRWLKSFMPGLLSPCMLPPSSFALSLQLANLRALSRVLSAIRNTGRSARWRGEILNGIGRAYIGAEEKLTLGGSMEREERCDLERLQGLCTDIVKALIEETPSMREDELPRLARLSPKLGSLAKVRCGPSLSPTGKPIPYNLPVGPSRHLKSVAQPARMSHAPGDQLDLLQHYLDAEPGPACVFRQSPGLATVDLVWRNSASTEGVAQLARKWIEDNQDKIGDSRLTRQVKHKNEGRADRPSSRIRFRTDTEEGTGSTLERCMTWGLTFIGVGGILTAVAESEAKTESVDLATQLQGTDAPTPVVAAGRTHVKPSMPDALPLKVDLVTKLHGAWSAFSDEDAAVLPAGKAMAAEADELPSWLVPDQTASPETKEFYHLFAKIDWARTSIGPMDGWDQLLRSHVNICLSSPFPTVVSWGPEMVLLYNLPYSRVIGQKHPMCLGNTYPLAWSEIWDLLETVILDAYKGKGLAVEDQEMMLMRSEKLEESYFTYALVPIRGPDGDVVGIYVPNFDNTRRVLTERRIKSLQSMHRMVALAHNQEDLVEAALSGLRENPRDMPFVLLYVCDGTGLTTDEERTDAYLDEVASQHSQSHLSAGRTSNPAGNTRSGSSIFYDSDVVFRLAGHAGCNTPIQSDLIPLRISVAEATANCCDGPDAVLADNSIARCVTTALADNCMARMEAYDLSSVREAFQENTFGEIPTTAVSLLIRSSSEDRLHGVLVFGLSTRKNFDKDYEDYLSLVRGLIATGTASLKLHNEDLNRARLLAAMNKRKNEELQVLLKKREDELKALEARFFTSVEESPAGFWMVTEPSNGIVTYVNPSYIAMTGLGSRPPQEWRSTVHPADLARIEPIFVESFLKRVKVEFRFQFLDASGDIATTYVEASAGPVFDAGGRVVLVTGTLLDVTARKLNEMAQTERAEEATAMRRQQENLIDFVSHELRNPLSAICLAMDSMDDRLKFISAHVDLEIRQEVRGVVEDADVVTLCTVHMQRLVDDVLVMSKLDNDMLQICSVACNPVKLVNSTMKLFIAELTSKGVDYDFVVKPNVHLNPTVKLDPHRTSQILINLLTNAAKRKITITLDTCRGRPTFSSESEFRSAGDPEDQLYVLFGVKDTGKGISPRNLETLFQRFQQGNSKTHVNYGGHGLGLFICKRLSGLLGGDIHVESQVGMGSTFTFYVRAEESAHITAGAQAPLPNLGALQASLDRMPLRPSSAKMQPKPTQSSPDVPATLPPSTSNSGRPFPAAADGDDVLHVLLTEDNVVNLRLLQKQLTKAGAIVLTAQNGLEALEMFRKSAAAIDGGHRIDCCLMDIEMPLMGGLQCTTEIRRMEARGELRHTTPIIAVTANARDGQQSQMREAGMTDVVPKPFTTKALMEKIRSLCPPRR